MAKFNVTNVSSINLPPTEVGDITINIVFAVGTHVFTPANFTTETVPVYSDPEEDDVFTVKITALPTLGSLELSAVAVNVNDEITLADITAGNLTYDIAVAETAGYSDSDMTFNIADDGSETYGVITDGIVTFAVTSEINLPPSDVGDNIINLTNGEFYTFTSANFTTETTPAYVDPEGDAPYKVKILTLPANGTLKFNGTNVIVNQEVTVAEIDAGLLTYVPDVSIKTVQSLTFDFAVSDVGSEGFTS